MEPTNHVKYLGLYLMDAKWNPLTRIILNGCKMEPTNHVKYLGLYLMDAKWNPLTM